MIVYDSHDGRQTLPEMALRNTTVRLRDLGALRPNLPSIVCVCMYAYVYIYIYIYVLEREI